MNQLNSIILEGNVSEKPVFDEVKGTFDFPIAVKRFYKNEDGSEELETSHFNIRSYGKMAEVCKDKCTVDRGIRVVGRLKEENSKVIVIAEHIEFKPKSKKA